MDRLGQGLQRREEDQSVFECGLGSKVSVHSKSCL